MSTKRDWLEPGHINARPDDMGAPSVGVDEQVVRAKGTVASDVQGKARWVA